MACYFSRYELKTGNTFFISNAGFESAGMADSVSGPLTAGFKDAKLIEDMRKALKEFRLDGIVDVKNPLDLTPMASDAAIGRITHLALSSANWAAAFAGAAHPRRCPEGADYPTT